MRRAHALFVLLLGAAAIGMAAQAPTSAPAAQVRVAVRNPLPEARPSETIVLAAAAITPGLAVTDLRRVYVRDDRSGADVLAQPVDVNDDGTFDELVFQVDDLAAGETRAFTLTVGERRVFTKDQFKAYGRFVRERRDDFAWENDRTAHRMYGAALETFAREPLTSSAVDIWFKRTRRLVINDWYMVDDYHRDLGEGADLYSAGRTRGCGGNAPWEAGRMWPSANFRISRVIANGPIRIMFELTYVDWDVNGRQVRERKRVTLDAGHQLNRFESEYTSAGALPTQVAAGIRIQPTAAPRVALSEGLLRTWDVVKGAGYWGCGVVMTPSPALESADSDGSHVLVARVPAKGPAVYYAGGAWDRAGDIADAAAWDTYLAQMSRRIRTPVEVRVVTK